MGWYEIQSDVIGPELYRFFLTCIVVIAVLADHNNFYAFFNMKNKLPIETTCLVTFTYSHV